MISVHNAVLEMVDAIKKHTGTLSDEVIEEVHRLAFLFYNENTDLIPIERLPTLQTLLEGWQSVLKGLEND
jgi:hypothetical protein